jgi:hypothetical protein
MCAGAVCVGGGVQCDINACSKVWRCAGGMFGLQWVTCFLSCKPVRGRLNACACEVVRLRAMWLRATWLRATSFSVGSCRRNGPLIENR